MDENIKHPAISVVMPLYNGEKYLKEAINSILEQTYSDFELLLIDDASSDRTEEIIRSYKDDRIVYIKNEQNLGLIKTLNKGLDLAKGEFIARMDQDDISAPTRFEEQIAIFKNNPEIGVCGTWFTIIKNDLEDGKLPHPVYDENIKIALLGYCSLGHPTVMLRKKSLGNLRYDEDFQAAEDYEFWTRLSRVTKLHNIPKILLSYRIHSTNMSVLERNIQDEVANKIIGRQLSYIGISNNDRNIENCKMIFSRNLKIVKTSDDFKQIVLLANEIETKNVQAKIYDKIELSRIISLRLTELLRHTTKDQLSLITLLAKQRKDIMRKLGIMGNIKLFFKIVLTKFKHILK